MWEALTCSGNGWEGEALPRPKSSSTTSYVGWREEKTQEVRRRKKRERTVGKEE